MNASNHSEGLANDCYPCFLFLFRVLGDSPLRSVAGLENALDESCNGDIEDELVQNLTTIQGQQEVRSFPSWHNIVFPRLVMCGF